MSITGMSDRLVTIKRRSANVLNPTPAAAVLPIDMQPARNANIEVSVNGGTTNDGTVTVFGLVGGVADSETLTFNGISLTKMTNKTFDAGSLTSITSTGLADEATIPDIVARAVGSDGSRHHSATTLVTGWPARFDRARASWPQTPAGRAAVEKTRFYIDYTELFEPRRGDIIIDQRTGLEYKVHGTPPLHGASLNPHHWEIEVQENRGGSSV